ncbi:MAG: Crp/Fnr family transcriptional regulator [Ginsengibacter sp.]
MLTQEEQALLRSSFRLKRLQKRMFLLQEGNICRFENYVVEGCLHSYTMDSEGNNHTLHFAIDDWWITDFESFQRDTPASRNIVALEDTVLLQIKKADLEDLYRNVPVLNNFFRILLENGTIAQDRRVINNISMKGSERYEWFLKTYPIFSQRIPQKYIASYLGITPEFLSNIRKEMIYKH